MKRMLYNKLPKFIICWSVIVGMILFSSPAFSRDYSGDRRSSNERHSSYNSNRTHKSGGSYKNERYSERNRSQYTKNKRYNERNRSHSVRVIHHDNLVPAIIATGLIAGITFSLLNNDPPAPRAPASSYCPNVANPGVASSSVMVTAGLLNIRSGPALNNPSVGQIAGGTVLTVMGNTAGWYYVMTPGGVSGWVMAQYTSPVAPPVNG